MHHCLRVTNVYRWFVLLGFALGLLGCAEVDLGEEVSSDSGGADGTGEESDGPHPGDSDSGTGTGQGTEPEETDTGTDSGTGDDTGPGDTGPGDTEGRCTPENAVEKCGAHDLCVDGYCCDKPCDGDCRACDVPGSEGTCTTYSEGEDPEGECGTCRVCNGSTSKPACVAVPFGEDAKDDCALCRVCNGEADDARCVLVEKGLDPLDECAEEEAGTCGQSGLCDGNGACALYEATTVCEAPQCNDARLYVSRCDGNGECVAGSRTCGGFLCDNERACLVTCETDLDCLDGYLCLDGACTIIDPMEDGAECFYDSECSSDHCADLVCCDGACEENCHACDLEGSKGTCTRAPANTDPKGDCPTCFACGAHGACELVPLGEDYASDCREDPDGEGCGLSGLCDGKGGCAFRGADFTCGESLCTDVPRAESVLATRVCDGEGSCVTAVRSCGSFVCADESSCEEQCTSDEQCIVDVDCVDDLCVLGAPDGTPCVDWFQCASSNCQDGYCCESECDGACERCDLPDALGACLDAPDNTDEDGDCPVCEVCVKGECAPAPAGEDPKSDCARGTMGECAQTGMCDGKSACELRGDDYPCGFACVGDEIAELTCDGVGIGQEACNVVGDTKACDDHLACDAEERACRTSCFSDSGCADGYFCDADNTCKPKADLGAECSAPSECLGNLCVDGVCCDDECAGVCEACNLEDALGTCSPYLPGTDPDDDCQECSACDGEGACAPLDDADAPEGDCGGDEECGYTGRCLQGACEFEAPGTPCGEGLTCGGPDDDPVTNWSECDGAGTCEPKTGTCGGYRCTSASACGTSCIDYLDCADGFGCNDDNQCASSNPNGTPCQLDTECASEMCVDGFCCESACDGLCESCGIAGAEGSCTPEPSGEDSGIDLGTGQLDCGTCQVCDGARACRAVDTSAHPEDSEDPHDRCATDLPASCGFTGKCGEGTGACAYYPASQKCDESCPSSGNTLYDWHCDGAGDCVVDDDPSGTCPDGYNCLASADGCRTECTLNAHCAGAAYYCLGGSCVLKKSDGSTCSAAFECSSNNCVDGRCCDTSCTGLCKSCAVSGHLGTCWNIPDDDTSDAECNDDKYCTLIDTCDGKGGCRHEDSPCNETDANDCNDCNETNDTCAQPSGTLCGDGPSADGCSRQDTCNASGVCLPNHEPSTEPCAPDSDVCTEDHCNGSGTCVHDASGAEDCDGDGVCDAGDNCPDVPNASQSNSDGDAWGNACDLCPSDFDNEQTHTDLDQDGRGDICDDCPNNYSEQDSCNIDLSVDTTITQYNSTAVPVFRIHNHGSTSVSRGSIKIRYWYTVDAPITAQTLAMYSCDQCSFSTSSSNFHDVSSLDLTDANYYVELILSSGATIAAGGVTGEIRAGMQATRPSPPDGLLPYDTNAANDHSYLQSSSWQENFKVTLYYQDNLVWGVEPAAPPAYNPCDK